MGSILHRALAEVRKPSEAVSGVTGYVPCHRNNDGEMLASLGELPVLVRYELTTLGAEVTEVCISGQSIPAGFFAADTLTEWARDCERSRIDQGMTL